jgi:hypothetical protein
MNPAQVSAISQSINSMKIDPSRFQALAATAILLGGSCMFAISSAAQVQEQTIATKMLKQLESPDLDSQMDALDTLATSLDPSGMIIPLRRSGP